MTKKETNAKKDYEAIVEKAVQELTGLGKEISVTEVLKLTGGSKRDIAPAVSRVKEKRRHREQQLWAAPDIPVILQNLFADLWSKAFELASADFKTLSKNLQDEIARQKQESDEYYKLLVETEDEASSWRVRAEDSDRLVATLRDEIADLKGSLHNATSRLEERRELEEFLKVQSALGRWPQLNPVPQF